MEEVNSGSIYGNILKEHEYKKLLFSNLINRFGDSVESIAFVWIVYQITHSAAWSAIIFALNMLPNVIVQPFAGVIVERLNKKHVVIATHFLRALVIIFFVILFRLHMVNPLVLSIFTILITTAESFNMPAGNAFVAQVLKEEDINAGISLITVINGVATLVGSGSGGFIIAKLGVGAAMFTDVATFIIAAILIALIKDGCETFNENADEKISKDGGFIKMLKEGIRYVFMTPEVRNFCVICVVLNCLIVPITALQAPIADKIFGMGSELLSIGGVFASIGGIIGASALPYLSKKLSPFGITMIGIAMLAVGTGSVALGRFVRGNAVLSYALVSICLFIVMSATSLVGGVLNIQFMKSVDKDFMARASAVFNSFAIAATPLGSLIVSMLVTRISVSHMLIVDASLAIGALLVLMILRPSLGRS